MNDRPEPLDEWSSHYRKYPVWPIVLLTVVLNIAIVLAVVYGLSIGATP